ncbi:hypothetical protein PC129_g761 [Phytophthora cactorum]|uniref:Uncharacterized protein n=1 Tax=Phytophthora cactorum TaxID=29920 RepID=A0A329SUS6_9STRA|nr:hypothetical protein Pcac1_g262 [Phytophthora cactorum]KAG2848840.1 hypothetical protein PC111_g304 [Phytophthora cactorum]KAG2849139.1 hypothetical protein PC112_g453 [Phytophthora cactorum]KAG2869021.1 hypothetical protein PC113_g537 [Phytophthora cactorum]KAG2934953.1 hypothetical protein PC114_g816 [Phytophthora cactorum]
MFNTSVDAATARRFCESQALPDAELAEILKQQHIDRV